ncbi:MAG: trypsin-like peptidase domain-containing protein [Dactylosporangium sp.]|nr:serine protease [Dactylosporangium sp.]NNJ62711.1 trypsin-like peptidase domain-containing protein [Dactylosporangium sp.]
MGAIDQLIGLVRDCVVQVRGTTDNGGDGGFRGSGFFIAQDTVLTCAHVAGDAGDRVTVRWRGRGIDGVVRRASPRAGRSRIAPYPDLALVTVSPQWQHPVVLLDDHLPNSGTTLAVAGHAQNYGSEIVGVDGRFTFGGLNDRMIRLNGDEITPGMSGAPVLDGATGGVCAVTKATRTVHQPAGGGVAVPVRGLRHLLDCTSSRTLWDNHDRYHRCNRRWTNLADRLPPPDGGIDRATERELIATTMRLPADPQPQRHLATYHRIAGPVTPEPQHPLRDYRDVVSELAVLVDPAESLPYPLTYAIDLARVAEPSDVADQLRWWVVRVAARLGLSDQVEATLAHPPDGEPPPPRPTPSVMVCIRPVTRTSSRYRYMIWRYLDETDAPQVAADQRPAPLERVYQRLRELLPDLVEQTAGGEHPTMIEFIVPFELMDEAVDRWPVEPGSSRSIGFGLRHPVVVRALDRFDASPGTGRYWRWERRWGALDGRDMAAALRPLACTERPSPEQMTAMLQPDDALAALLLLPYPVRHPAAKVVLDAGVAEGVPVMVWRRRGCTGAPDRPHDTCRGRQLHVAVRDALRDTRREEVPERVRRIRYTAVIGGDDDHCGNDIVLLWDDPGRRPTGSVLVSPNERRHLHA